MYINSIAKKIYWVKSQYAPGIPVKFIIFSLLFLVYFFLAKSNVSAACQESCSPGYAESCVADGYDGCTMIDDSAYGCYWTCIGGGSSNVCTKPGVPVNCPANTVRSETVTSSVCMGFCRLGTAQESGTCCDWVTTPASGCNWVDCPGPQCRNECAEPESTWCRTHTTKTYSCTPVCSAGDAPDPLLPANGQIYAAPLGAVNVDFSWVAPTAWGTGESSGDRGYNLCVGSNSTDPCLGGDTYTNTGETTTDKTASVPAGQKYWSVAATNMCGSTSVPSTVRSMCIEGNSLPADNGVGNTYYSQWSSCDANHIRTRTCTEDCGTDNCAAAASAGLLQEDCEGEIRGTLFDATDLVSCPSFDPVTGYIIGADTNLTANNKAFGISDQSNVSPHPWTPLSAIQTDSSGNYAIRVYAPASYTYDFTNLKDIYVISSGPKLTCTAAVATVPGNSVDCGTQPCSKVNNMSFGFNRYWGGWWQVVGASVHGEEGLRSSIPNALPTEQSLILPDATATTRRGLVSYGEFATNMLGVNQNAKVSTNLWQAQSHYDGVIYDYAYFNQQFKKYATTLWDGASSISYDPNGKDYQIFKVTGPVANFSYNPTGTEKVIFLINGDVTINSNLTVPGGSFMTIIANGDITFGTAVTRADGWFLGKNINVRCVDSNSDLECDRTDVQFNGNGSFVGWKGINLTRDQGGATNITQPAELFTYRLDLYNNAPEPMKIITKRYKPYVP